MKFKNAVPALLKDDWIRHTGKRGQIPWQKRSTRCGIFINVFTKRRERKKTFTVRVPGSKSITNRALLLSMLSDGDCVLKGALFSDDSRYLVQCIADLGFAITADEAAEEIRVRGLGGRIPKRKHPFTLEAQERPPVS